MRTFYVAAKFERKAEVAALIRRLRGLGQEVLGDWTGHSIEGVDEPMRSRMLLAFACEDRRAVAACDVFLLLHGAPAGVPESGGRYVELGIAVESAKQFDREFNPKRVIIIGGSGASPSHGPIFYDLPEVEHYDTVDQALEALGVIGNLTGRSGS